MIFFGGIIPVCLLFVTAMIFYGGLFIIRTLCHSTCFFGGCTEAIKGTGFSSKHLVNW